jgi:isoleucyl-tRNA synthetase
MESLGADAVRWYMIVNNPPWKTTLFNTDDISKTVISDFFRSLTNTYNFFAMYSEIDGVTGNESVIGINDRPEIDRWILSKSNSLVEEFTSQMDDYEVTRAHRGLQEFCVNDLSNWYIRRNRRRFWKGDIDDDKLSAYQTLREVLLTIVKLMSSTAPFLSEHLYQLLKSETDILSVHMCDLPKSDTKLMDRQLEERMDIAQRVVFLTRSLREKSEIKTRQPLKRILVPVSKPADRRNIEAIADIVKEEINIKYIEFLSETTADIVKRKAKPNFPVMGKVFGKTTNKIANIIKGFVSSDIDRMDAEGEIQVEVEGETVTIKPEYMDIYSEDIEGWLVSTDRGITVALDTTLDEDLINEGIAREFVSKVQNARKENGFEIVDRINIKINADSQLEERLLKSSDYIKNETLADSILREVTELPETVETDKGEIRFKVDKSS